MALPDVVVDLQSFATDYQRAIGRPPAVWPIPFQTWEKLARIDPKEHPIFCVQTNPIQPEKPMEFMGIPILVGYNSRLLIGNYNLLQVWHIPCQNLFEFSFEELRWAAKGQEPEKLWLEVHKCGGTRE